LSDATQAGLREVHAVGHPTDDHGERLEVRALRSYQWVCFEERNDPPDEVGTTLDRQPQKRVAMIVLPHAFDHGAAPDDVANDVEGGSRWLGLRDGELMLDLPAEPTRGVTHH